MSRLLRTISLLGAALAPAVAGAACNPVDAVGCKLVHCSFEGDQGVRITLAQAVERWKSAVPATVTFCAADRCADVSLRLAGDSFACISKDIRATCEVGDDGSLAIAFAVALPETGPVPVKVTVRSAAGETVFEETKEVPIVESDPGLDCPEVCREAEASFSPGPSI